MQDRPPRLVSCTVTVPSGSPLMLVSFAVIVRSSVRQVPALLLCPDAEPDPDPAPVVPCPAEPVPEEALPPLPPLLPPEFVPAESVAPPWPEPAEPEPPEEDAAAEDDGLLCPALSPSLWHAVSERLAATARAARVTL
ncbi:hypothetical protein ACE1SV_40640 [Streptomyces sennicomposti]